MIVIWIFAIIGMLATLVFGIWLISEVFGTKRYTKEDEIRFGWIKNEK